MRQEVYVPYFSTPLAEAYLDAHVLGIPELEGLYFDITVRHPRDARYAPTLCASTDGVALQRAAAEKQTRYPASNQGRVITLGVETWGRMSEEGEHILAICAACAIRHDHRRGRHASSARLRRWRAALDGALQASIAAQLAHAAAGVHGRAHAHRRRAADFTALELTPAPGAFTAGVTPAARHA